MVVFPIFTSDFRLFSRECEAPTLSGIKKRRPTFFFGLTTNAPTRIDTVYLRALASSRDLQLPFAFFFSLNAERVYSRLLYIHALFPLPCGY